MTTPALETLDSPVRRHIVDLLANLPAGSDPVAEPPGRTAAEIAEEIGLHVTTARFHLDLLVRHELLEAVFRRGGVGRPRKIYRLRRRAVPDGGNRSEEALQALTGLLAETWRADGDDEPLTAEQAGERWALEHAPALGDPDRRTASSPGAWLGKVGRTVDLLHRWGYTPEVRTTDGGRTAELTLVDCPFLDLATTHPDVVCGIHRGLLRGALRAVGEEETEVGLHPFVGPTTCRARITTRAPFEAPHGPAT